VQRGRIDLLLDRLVVLKPADDAHRRRQHGAAELRLTYQPDDEWVGELNAIVTSGAFSGQGTAWFDRKTLKESFIAALRAFPLTPAAPPMIEGGFWSKENRGSLDQCHLRLAITPYNPRGTLLVRIDLASPSRSTPDLDRQQTVTVRFWTEYAAIAEFADQLDRVLDGTKEQAVPGSVIG
jgi:hypothetical protein